MEKNLYARYAALKQKVGGNREKKQFEFTMGPSVLEKNRITPMPEENLRILSQIQFALELSERNQGIYENEIEKAMSVLEYCIKDEGVLTRSACKAAEEYLLPLTEAAKEYEIIYASHAHIDMNWMWGWQETVAATLSTFRTILNLMEEYPEFTFSQSQASVYKIVEEYDPEMMKEIQSRIMEGRWEVTANAWVETDKNMPDTESLIRHIQVTRNYLQEIWGIAAGSIKVDFSPDTFGHSRFVPEINTFADIPYYYHCRGLQQDLTLYRYKAPSGSEILMYKEPYWYNSGVNPDNGTGVFEIEKRCGGLKTALIVYGVGNHGGGPTRRDIERIIQMQSWPVFPKLRFGTLHEYFKIAETVREQLPIVDHELNAIFTGCYSTQSRIKLANRRAERALLASEGINALSCGLSAKGYDKAWQNVLFTHFHDILTGSCVQESREYAMGKLAEAIAAAQTQQSKAYERISRNVNTSMFKRDAEIGDTQSEGAGVGFGIGNYAGVPNPERGAGKVRIYTVFNSTVQRRKEITEFTLWDYNGDLQRIEVVDHEGNMVPYQLLDKVPQQYWDHYYVRLAVMAEVPPMGYNTYAVQEKEIMAYPTLLMQQEREELPKGILVLENNKLRAQFDTGSGMLFSIVNKQNGEELLSGPAGLHLVRTANEGMTAWRIGRYLGMEPVTDTVKVVQEQGTLRNSITFEQRILHSRVKMTISLDADAEALKYALSVDWHETCSGQEEIPVLTYRLPLKKETKYIRCDVPGGMADREARHIDVPALSGVVGLCEGTTLGLITDCKYGYRLAENVLSVTLIHTAGDPDPYPERGIHAIELFVTLTDGTHVDMKNRASWLIQPMTAVPTGWHKGVAPEIDSLLDVQAEHSVLTSIQKNDKGELYLRFYEAEGREEMLRIQLPFGAKSAVVTKLDGTPIGEATVQGQWVQCTISPYSMIQVQVNP